MSDTIDFERCWGKFTTRVKGRLMEKNAAGQLNYGVAKLILSDSKNTWELKYDECGRWLSDYEKIQPEKARLVKQVLVRDMKFSEEKIKEFPASIPYISSAIGAAVGFGVATLLDANMLITAAATLVPVAAIFPATTGAGKTIKKNNSAVAVDAYMTQLDKYKASVLSILGE